MGAFRVTEHVCDKKHGKEKRVHTVVVVVVVVGTVCPPGRRFQM